MDIRELQSFFDQSQDIIAVLDQDLRYEAANSEYCRYWGKSRNEVIGARLADIVGRVAEESQVQDSLAQCLEGKDVHFNRWLDFPGVGRRHMDARFSPRRDESGEITGIFLIARDNTLQYELQAEVRRERDKLDEILSSLDIGLALFNPDLTIQWVNKKLANMFPDAQMIGEKCHKAFKGADTACEECVSLKALETGRPCSMRIHHQSDGRWYSFSSAPVFDDEGNVVQALGHLIDTTEQRLAEEAIRESEHRFRNLFESVDMIAVQGYDEDRRVTYWNPASEALYGYSRDEAMGQLLEDLIIPDSMREAVKKGHELWVSGGPAIPPGELELRHKDGSPVPVYSSHVMQETAMGKRYMYCIDVELAEIKRIHNRLVQARDEAEAANLAKSEFLANMSHEIRTPLNGVQGMLTLLQSTGLDENQREYVQAGLESAVRLNRLLSDILDLSRVEAGKLTINRDIFDLRDIVRQVHQFYSISNGASNVRLECDVAPDVPSRVVGDGARLQQILTNLVGNGLKFTDSGFVRIEVSCLSPLQDGKHRIFFTVSDTGIGIGREALDSLFEPFTQGSGGYSRQYQGAGLGLSICRRLVDLMGGNMSVVSEEGRGTTVHAVLKFDQESAAERKTASVYGGGLAAPVRLRVLLAEDDRINSIVGKRLLEKQGCRVELAVDGKDAMAKLREQAFDAVLMDIQMPKMDGLEATAAIRSGEAGEGVRDIPVFALTAYTMAGDREKFLEAGMNGYIPKPVEVDDIRCMLSQVLAMQRGEKGQTADCSLDSEDARPTLQ